MQRFVLLSPYAGASKMNRQTTLPLFLLFATFALVLGMAASSPAPIAARAAATGTAAASVAPHWTYEGAEGPDKWGSLDPSFAACASGRAQSPIDLSNESKINLTDIKFNY